MTKISLIAAIDEQYGLGKDNQLLCHLPADLKHFKTLTLGKPVIMGHYTYDSIGKPLPGRTNIVLTRRALSIEGVEIVSSLSEALALALVADLPEVMIIGGADVFKQTLPYANRIYLTKIHHQFKADVFFPKLDLTEWHCEESVFRSKDENNQFDMTFLRYEQP